MKRMKMWKLVMLIVLIPFVGWSQSENTTGTFKAGLVFGVNAAQIHGDELWGYDKLGLTAGGHVAVKFSELWEGNIEILFSQRGSRSNLNLTTGETNYTLDYIHVPVAWSYRDKGIRIYSGLAYSRMVNFNVLIQSVDETAARESWYKKNDFSFFAGGGYQFTDNWVAELKWERSILSILDYKNLNADPQWNVWIQFRGLYMF